VSALCPKKRPGRRTALGNSPLTKKMTICRRPSPKAIPLNTET
jgi:hypothetical protein